MSKPRIQVWLLLILLAAAFLRLHALPTIPPGMTHDEADHGLDAWGVVQGVRPLYFTVGYGREPLYDYSTAVLMTFLGPTYLAGRLTSAFFSLLMIAATYAWARRAVGAPAALLTAAFLAVSFWPVMVGRHALRTVTMPALFTLAALCFWRGYDGDAGARHRRLPVDYIAAGLFLGLSFYTYIPARLTWLAFPAFVIFLALARRPRPGRGTLVTLGIALLVGAPLFIFLLTNPAAEIRLDQLADPLRQATEGSFEPLFDNVVSGLSLLTITGDENWRYNIAGRPLLPLVVGLLFYAGLGWALVRSARFAARRSNDVAAPGLFFAVVWFVLGLAPALITGSWLSTTQAAGMQPVLYLFPALALVGLGNLSRRRWPATRRWLAPAALVGFGALFAGTANAYFAQWATAAPVAVQYEADLVAAVRYLNESDATAVAVSSDAPDRFHDPATARLYTSRDDLKLRWFDGRASLLLPAAPDARLVLTDAAPLHPALSGYLPPDLIPTHSGPGFSVYEVDKSAGFPPSYPQFSTALPHLSTELSTENAVFGDAVALLGYDLQTPSLRAGETARLATLWQPQATPDAALVLFTHILDADGGLVAQADRLDVPSHFWQPGDHFIQLHEVELPPDLPPGVYTVAVGVYPASDWRQRLPAAVDGAPVGDALPLTQLEVGP